MKNNYKSVIAVIMFLFLYEGMLPLLNAQNFVQPGIPFTQQDLNELKKNIRREPWKSGFETLAADSRSNIGYGQSPSPTAIVGRAPDVNRNPWMNDMIAVHNQAFMWVFTGDPTYADNGIRILNAWATTHTMFSGDEAHLDLGDHAQYFITGADILRTYEGWTDEIDRNVRKYFEQVFWPVAAIPYPLRPCNQGAFQTKFGIGLAVFLQDAVKLKQAIESFRVDGGGGLANSLPNGQVGDAGRDEGHWFGQYEALTWGAEVLWKQGIDVFSEEDNRMLAISELYTRYMVDDKKDTWIPFGGNYDWGYFFNFGATAGARRNSFAYSLIENAYKNRLGVQTPYTSAFEEIIGKGNNFLFIKESDNSKATKLEPISYPVPVEVKSLTSMDIGKVAIAGKTDYTDGKRTLNATGTIIQGASSDAFHYAFQPVEGNIQIVAHLTSLSDKGKSGVMIRNSLDENAGFVAFTIDPKGQSKLVGRGIQGWNSTRIGHVIPGIPHWIKLERYGYNVGAYHSQDGINWTCAGMVYFADVPDTYYSGICLTSTNNNQSSLEKAVFSHVGISQISPVGSPVITGPFSAKTSVGTTFEYEIKADGNPTSFNAEGLPSGLTVDTTTGKINGTATEQGNYNVILTAANAIGKTKMILVLTVTTGSSPAKPQITSLKETGINEVTLFWEPVENATRYSVKRSLTLGGEYETIMSNISQPTYTDKNANPGYNYYVVIAHENGSESEQSGEQSILLPPDIPQALVSTSKSNSITLQWEAAKGAEKYKIQRSETTEGPYTYVGSDVAQTTFIDNDVTVGTYYYYVVTSFANDKESQYSNEVLGVPGISTYIWKPDAITENWSDAANWQSGIAPTSPAILSFGPSVQSKLVNDIDGLEIGRILFEDGAPAYIFEGKSIKIKDVIQNNSENLSTIQFPMELLGNINVLVNNGNIRLEGKLSGTGGIIKRGKKNLAITGQNTYSGGTTVYDSTLENQLFVSGQSEFDNGTIIQGPLGTGLLTMSGGALQNEGVAWLYNDIFFVDGTENYSASLPGGIVLRGKIKGKGSWAHDGGWLYDGLTFEGDNSEFEGKFSSILRTSHSRIRFPYHYTTSAKAHWDLESNFNDNHSFGDTSAPYRLGALSGKGYLNIWNNVELEIGYLNTDTEFSGTTRNNSARITKVGNGKLTFSGILSHKGVTTVKSGKLIITGVLENSSVNVDNGGVFGGFGVGNGNIVVNGGGILAPGNDDIGTFTTTKKITLNENAVFEVQLGLNAGDKIIANDVEITNAVLNLSGEGGSEMIIIDNRGSNPVIGKFKDLDEFDEITVGAKKYCILYRGGDGNDVVLIDAELVTKGIPSEMQNLKGEAINSSQIKLTWDASPAWEFITEYIVKKSFVELGPYEELATGLKTPEYTDKNLSPETTYYYQVYAKNNFGQGIPVSVSVKTSEISIPLAPKGICAYAGINSIFIKWNASYEAASYTIKRSETADGPYNVLIENLTDTVYNDIGIGTGKTYYYVLESVNSKGTSALSEKVYATTVEGNLAYYPMDENIGIQAFDLWGGFHGNITSGIWTEGIKGGAISLPKGVSSFVELPGNLFDGVTDFTVAIWVKQETVGNWARIWDFGRGTANYMFLTSNTGGANNPVRFAIKNGGGEQLITSSHVLTNSLWTHIAVTLSGKTGILYINGKEAAKNTNITINPSMLGSFTQNYIGKSQFAADALFKGAVDELYIYNRALSSTEIKDLAELSSVSDKAPQNLRGENLGIGIKLDWDIVDGAIYNVKRASVAGGPYTTVAAGKKINTHTDLTAKDGFYYYVITAVVDGIESIPSTEVFIPTYDKPAILQNALITPLNSGRIKISWDASPASEHITGYTLKWSLSSTGEYETLVDDLLNTEYVHEPLISETDYYYKLFATNYFGESDVISLQARTPQLTDPQIPTGLVAEVGNKKVNLLWKVATEAYTYDILRSDSPEGNFETVASNITDTIYTDTLPENEHAYYYAIVAHNPLGASGKSVVVKAVPTDKLVYWNFDEGIGSEAVDVWNKQKMILNSSEWDNGKYRTGIKIGDTGNHYGHIPGNVISCLDDEYTIAAWIKQRDFGSWGRIWDFGRGTNNYMFLASNFGSASNPIRFAIKNGGTEQQINCSYVMKNNEWVHIAITFSGNTGTLYVNGVEAGKNAAITIKPSQLGDLTNCYIAKSQFAADGMFKGVVDEFRIYNRALSQEDLEALVAVTAPDAPENLISVLNDLKKVVLSWDEVVGRDAFTVKRSATAEGPYTVITQNEKSASFVDESPLEGINYYVVAASINGVEGPSSAITSIEVPYLIPLSSRWFSKNGSSDWFDSSNWSDGVPGVGTKVTISKSDAYPVLTEPTSVGNIYFEAGAELGRQDLLTYEKAFVDYDFGQGSRSIHFHSLSVPLMEAFAGDFTFGGQPDTYIQSLSVDENGRGKWIALSGGNSSAFTPGTGFALSLDPDKDSDKGLSLSGGILRLPFFDIDSHVNAQVHPNHTYADWTSTFTNPYGAGFYTVTRSPNAFKLAGAQVSVNPQFGQSGSKIIAMVGNPFMSTIDFEQLYLDNAGLIKNNYQIWTKAGNQEGYAGYSPEGNWGLQLSPEMDELIAPLQGFTVERKDEATGTLDFNLLNLSSENTGILRSAQTTGNKLDIVAKNSEASVRTFIAEREGGCVFFSQLDARKLINNLTEVPEIYTLKPSDKGMVAVGANITAECDAEYPLGLATSYRGTLTLTFSGMDSYNARIFFADKYLNKTIELTGLNKYEYSFINETRSDAETRNLTAVDDRFTLRLASATASLEDEFTLEHSVNVYNQRGHICVFSVDSDLQEVKVYNLNGTLIYGKNGINLKSYVSESSFSAGVYIVEVKTDKNVTRKKIIINNP